MSRIKHANPALVVSILALVAALAMPAVAKVASSLTKQDKRVIGNIARSQANRQIAKRTPRIAKAQVTNLAPGIADTQITDRAPGLNVDKVDGKDASDFTPAEEVHSPSRVVVDDSTPDDGISTDVDLVSGGPFTVTGSCKREGGLVEAAVDVHGPAGTSFAGGGIGDSGDATSANVVGISSSINSVNAGQMTAVAQSGEVLTVNAAVETKDPDGECIFGVTTIGP